MMFTIEIDYSTGNSFGTYQETSTVEFVWSKLEDAKLALEYIKQHHEFYTRYRAAGRYAGYHGSTDTAETILQEAKGKPWYVESRFSTGFNEFSLKVPSDDAEHNQLSVFWHGYFETLHGAEIVKADGNNVNNDMSFRV